MRSGALARILFLNELYEKIVHLPGCVIEFGTWWGQSLVLFDNLRVVHEPYNLNTPFCNAYDFSDIFGFLFPV